MWRLGSKRTSDRKCKRRVHRKEDTRFEEIGAVCQGPLHVWINPLFERFFVAFNRALAETLGGLVKNEAFDCLGDC
jgi:hypothetical protein